MSSFCYETTGIPDDSKSNGIILMHQIWHVEETRMLKKPETRMLKKPETRMLKKPETRMLKKPESWRNLKQEYIYSK